MIRSRMVHAVLILLTLFPACSPDKKNIEQAFRDFKGRYVFLVSKRRFTLEVYDRNLKVVASYRIGYGLNPDRRAKVHAGDNRTPEGFYRINEILSMDAGSDSPSYRKLAAMNRVYWRAREGHYKYGNRDADLGDNAYGPRFFGIDYPNSDDVRRYKTQAAGKALPLVKGKVPLIGSGMAIHGNADEVSIGHLSSSGCVRMYNSDIVELDKYIQIGTPVIISAD